MPLNQNNLYRFEVTHYRDFALLLLRRPALVDITTKRMAFTALLVHNLQPQIKSGIFVFVDKSSNPQWPRPIPAPFFFATTATLSRQVRSATGQTQATGISGT